MLAVPSLAGSPASMCDDEWMLTFQERTTPSYVETFPDQLFRLCLENVSNMRCGGIARANDKRWSGVKGTSKKGKRAKETRKRLPGNVDVPKVNVTPPSG